MAEDGTILRRINDTHCIVTAVVDQPAPPLRVITGPRQADHSTM